MKIFQIKISRAALEVLGDPSGVKMAQDASWIASGAEFGDLLGLILSPRWPKLGQNGAKEPKMVNLAPFWEASWVIFRILSAILATKNRSVKTTNTTNTCGGFSRVGSSSGGSFGSYFGRCWLQDGVFWVILSDVMTSWC